MKQIIAAISSVFMLLNITAAPTAIAAEQFKIITLQYRFAQEVLPMIEPLVGPDGAVHAIDNHLMVSTSVDRLAQIEALIDQLDVARKNVRISVSHSAGAELQQRGAGVSARGRVGEVEIALPRGASEGLNIDLYDSNTRHTGSGTGFLSVVDGERAFIRVGQSVPYTQQWVLLTRRYVSVQQSVAFRDITTGFAVRPRYIGDQVELEITPRIANLNQAGYVDFEELSTVVRVSPGEWFDLGGNMQNRDEVSREIMAVDQRSDNRKSTLRIKVD